MIKEKLEAEVTNEWSGSVLSSLLSIIYTHFSSNNFFQIK